VGGTIGVTLATAGARVRLEVHNAGAVPPEVQARFFQKYATHGKEGGFGLGAYSAHLMARVQAGELVMRTSPETGTTLSLELGAAPAVQAERSTAALPALRVLVVDDDEYNITFIRAT